MQIKVASRQSPVASKENELHDRFAAFMQPLFFPSRKTGDWRLATALSGGADSMALALIADDWARACGGRIIALTVDHGLRADSRNEATQVATWMRARGIEHHILTPPMQPEIRNPQAHARARRYEALTQACADLGCTHMLLAHHADDQAETVALQRHRGSTPPSRAGMPAMRTHGNLALVRPLLGTRKRALVEFLREQNQPWVEDPSNQNDRYARNRLRTTLGDSEIVALWHEAQRAGKMRHDEEVARNSWMETHTHAIHGCATLDRGAWLVLPTAQRMDYLSHAIRIIGGNVFRSRLAETERLTTRIADEVSAAATLGHCRIVWRLHEITITPEHASATPLDTRAIIPHMQRDTENILVSMPFWCFSLPLIG